MIIYFTALALSPSNLLHWWQSDSPKNISPDTLHTPHNRLHYPLGGAITAHHYNQKPGDKNSRRTVNNGVNSWNVRRHSGGLSLDGPWNRQAAKINWNPARITLEVKWREEKSLWGGKNGGMHFTWRTWNEVFELG